MILDKDITILDMAFWTINRLFSAQNVQQNRQFVQKPQKRRLIWHLSPSWCTHSLKSLLPQHLCPLPIFYLKISPQLVATRFPSCIRCRSDISTCRRTLRLLSVRFRPMASFMSPEETAPCFVESASFIWAAAPLLYLICSKEIINAGRFQKSVGVRYFDKLEFS